MQLVNLNRFLFSRKSESNVYNFVLQVPAAYVQWKHTQRICESINCFRL